MTAYKPLSGGITPAQLKEFEDTQNDPAPEDNQDTLDATDPQEPAAPSEDPYESRYWNLKKYHDETIRKERDEKEAERKRAEALEAQLAKRINYAPDDAVKQFEEEYEVAPVIKELAARVSDEKVAQAQKKFEEVLARKEVEQRKQAEGLTRLAKAHPDYAQLDEDPIFNEWLNTTSNKNLAFKRTIEEAQKGDFDAAILVFDMFKAQVRPKTSGPDKKELSRSPSPSSQADVPKGKEMLSESEWLKKFTRAEKTRNLDLQTKLIEEYEVARKENRLTH